MTTPFISIFALHLPPPSFTLLPTTWFNLFGWPSSIRSDGGPQFRGEFTRFCETNKISHELSAPYNPKSNGLAEAGVKSVKNILRKSMSSGSNADFMLYEWRNVPRSDGYSLCLAVPSSLLFPLCLRKMCLSTSHLLHRLRMLLTHDLNWTMTDRSFP